MTAHDAPFEPGAPAVLAVDVGGSHVKILLNGAGERRRFTSGKRMTAAQMVAGVLELAEGLAYEVVTVGVPAPVLAGRVIREPANLGKGWAGFDFPSAFGRPTKVVNDAAMQALELSARGSWRATLDGGAVLEIGRAQGESEVDELAERLRRFVASLPELTRRYQSPVLYADLRHRDGYALRLKNVSTLSPGEKGTGN